MWDRRKHKFLETICSVSPVTLLNGESKFMPLTCVLINRDNFTADR